ncbi:MAG: hypothetical protein CSA34_07330 [Desulfobulbus propionicus]|nr:MAG: hypothetical protein CSA34_07330 [Desulfobulbus propionicus]
MENNAELARLEQFIDKLLGQYNQLKADYHGLQSTLQDREQEITGLKKDIDGLQQQISSLSSQRTEVGTRVSGLLSRIEQWEADHESSSETGGMQAVLFSETPAKED